MDKKEKNRLLKRISSGPEMEALELLFDEHIEKLKEAALKEEDDIAKVIGSKKAIDSLKRILKQIDKSDKIKNKRSLSNYTS